MPCSNIRDLPREAGAPDLLGVDDYARAIESFAETADTPMTIAIQGEWGCGKTSMMNHIRSELCQKKDDFHAVWINTWQYALFTDECSAMIKIIKSILDQVLAVVDEGANQPSKSSIAAKRVLAGLAKGVTRMGAGIVGAGAVADELIKSIPTGNVPIEVTVNDLRNEISKSINQYIAENPEKRGFLIFIDDLDRIEPVTAVNILELLKNIFDIEYCLFILAIDYDVIVKGLKPKFGELTQQNEREFRSFFDKIIQLPFSMPVASYKVDGFLLDSLRKIEYFEEENLAKIEVAQTLSRISSLSVGRNPRAMKRLTNILSLIKIFNNLCNRVNETNDELHERLINFALICIQLAYPRIYDLLSDTPDFTDQWDILKALQMGLVEKETNNEESQDGKSESESWIEFIKYFCNQDIYLKNNCENIIAILEEIITLRPKKCKETLPEILEKLLALSSVTQVSVNTSGSVSKQKYKKNYVDTFEDWISEKKIEGYDDSKLMLITEWHDEVIRLANDNDIMITVKYTGMINFYAEGQKKAFALSWPNKSGSVGIVLRINEEVANILFTGHEMDGSETKGGYRITLSHQNWEAAKPVLSNALLHIISDDSTI